MKERFSAGRKGKDVRSDCWVQIEPRTTGGIELVINSKVSAMFGDSLRQQCLEVIQALEIDHAKVDLEDVGALPYTIAARLETAAQRAGLTKQVCLLPIKSHSLYDSSRDRLRRSRLYLPGNEPKFFINAGLHKPDAVILDLEDSVAPAEKDAARFLIRNALRQVDFYGSERMVRINQGDMGLEDLEWIVPHNVHLILIPKVESPEQVKAVEKKICEIRNRIELKQHQSEEYYIPDRIFLMPIIESAKGALFAYDIAIASENNVALAIGLEDYTADIGVERTNEGKESFWLRSVVVNAARAVGIQPIDTVFSNIDDDEGLRASVKEARALGFDGKGCIHPRQIRIVHEAFAPEPKELEKALKIVEAWKDAQAKGLGVVSLGSKMIDPPVVKRALRIVELSNIYNRNS